MKIRAHLCALIAVCVLVAGIGAQDNRPNIVLIMSDDLGFSDLGCYGGEIETPNLDQLAANGIRFTDFHNNAKCSETRASLLTGLWHQQSKNLKQPGHVTLAEVLKEAGYTTLMSGKWHLAGQPRDRGFDRYFGFLSGAIDFYTGIDWGGEGNLMRLEREEFVAGEGFYATDAFTDYAIKFLEEENTDDAPFFLYLAYNAPHFPLHAPEAELDKYEGRYDEGWDVIRNRRHDRMLELGLIDESWQLSQRDPKVEAWDEMTDESKEFLLPMIEAYAAMVDRLDQNIGRLVEHLKETDEFDNTIILFLSDNGACPYQRMRGDESVRVGLPGSDVAYDARWANMCNTPLRLYKQYAHEGGSRTPLIVHWPEGIAQTGSICRSTGHLVDLMPTFVELAEATYPERQAENDVFPMEGESLTEIFAGQPFQRDRPVFWEFSGNHAVRLGKWKLVAEKARDWELYDLDADPCETRDLSSVLTEQVAELADLYDAWANRTGAKSHERSQSMKPSKQSQLFDLK